MSVENPSAASHASWEQLELAVERLHAAARSAPTVRDFYRLLASEAADALAAPGAAAWQLRAGGRPELVARSLIDAADADVLVSPRHLELIARAFDSGDASIHSAAAQADGRKPSDCDCLLQPVNQPNISSGSLSPGERAGVRGSPGDSSPPLALIELWLPADASPPVRQGWLDFASALADVAADFHAWEELRRLRGAAAVHRQAVDLVRRVAQPRDLAAAAFESANEGRRLLGCQRLSVLVRRGGRWRLVAASGVDRVEPRTDFARRSEQLAAEVAAWGEAIDYSTQGTSSAAADHDLPPRLEAALEAHVDHSHARRLVAAPISISLSDSLSPGERAGVRGQHASSLSNRSRRDGLAILLLAERFDAPGDDPFRDHVVEIADLCCPALARAAQLDRFGVRHLLRWSDRWQALREPRRGARALAIIATISAALAALTLIRADFDVEAPATLAAAVQRDVFATAAGAVAEVRVAHGQIVEKGQTLVVLRDPDLALKLQQTRGEIDAARKRIDAIAVSRTERTLRENPADDRLPLSAEQRELEERLASLDLQLGLLEARRSDLDIRSPHAGQVLTRDVQSLLESRPVERGQILLTIADSSAGWELRADVPQRDIGHVVAAQREQSDPLAVEFRLAGDVARSFPGRVVEVSAAAPLDAEGLRDDVAPVQVRIALAGDGPPAARPGMTANVRIHCGRRSLAYVWLHDVAATLYRWITF